MLVLALNPGHDGAIAAVQDRELLFSFESEKDSFPRHAAVTPTTMIQALEHLDEAPDVIALGGWYKPNPDGTQLLGAGYFGSGPSELLPTHILGKKATFYSSSHERQHIMMAIGMAPKDDAPQRAVLVWEGAIGSFYLVGEGCAVEKVIPVLEGVGVRFAFLFALADPMFMDEGGLPRLEDSGKLMALAAFAEPGDATPEVEDTVERILTIPSVWPAPKHLFRNSPVYNAGVESDAAKAAAALITKRIFDIYAGAAVQHLPAGLPLYISGGCGLNCDWNMNWRLHEHFSSVFVPPCTNDSGTAIGTALDAIATMTGDAHVDWNVYSGQEFEWDAEPDPQIWERNEVNDDEVAAALMSGRIFAWIQGRCEIGPRALGNRSLLAEPFNEGTKDRLNDIKMREDYRPVAPCCRLEDVGNVYDADFEDPYMLYFRRATTDKLKAVTHVDGSARCQTVTPETNERLHGLLSAVEARAGTGVLCNTSLNFKGTGFINRMSDLVKYCQPRDISDMVVGDAWYRRRAAMEASSPPALEFARPGA